MAGGAAAVFSSRYMSLKFTHIQHIFFHNTIHYTCFSFLILFQTPSSFSS